MRTNATGRGGLGAGRRMQQLMCVTQPTCSLLHSMYVFRYVTPSVQRTTRLCASLAFLRCICPRLYLANLCCAKREGTPVRSIFFGADATLFNEVFVRANADISLLTPPLRRLLSPAPRSAIANAWVEQQRFVFSRQRLVADLPHTGLWPLCKPLRWQTSALHLRRQLGHRQPSCCEQTFGVQ